MGPTDVILGDIRRSGEQEPKSRAYVRAGPRESLYFEPTNVKAAVVTCGGLCPGLNNVIRDITLSLWNLYGVREIYGIRMGFAGFYNWTSMDQKEAPIMLTPQSVENIHHSGGTILGANRGGFDLDKILTFLTDRNISQLYVIGGDGTHRAANKIAVECRARSLRIVVAGVPKTIDNDVDLLDRSFGFNTAVEEAQRAIRSAKTEAKCVPNGIGVVKLMGRSAGFIAAHATLSSGDVNLCLVPEVPIELKGALSCLTHLERVIEEKGHAVVVVAEGAGEELLGSSAIVDAGGNKKLPPIGEFMKSQIQQHFAHAGKECTVKYIDPSYMIRSVPANAADSLYCMLLAQNAVHGAMAGYTGFTVGLSANRVVYFPITAITQNSPRCMDPFGRTWERVLCMTRQPNTVPDDNKPRGGISSD
jgi:6-phosphofructokinase 1